MSEDTLNEKLRNAIETNVDAPFSTMGVDGISEAANECEKIALKEQIDLLTDILLMKMSSGAYKILTEKLQSLTNKLNQL